MGKDMKAIDIGLIQARRAKLISEIERYREGIATLEAKLSELEIAERIFAELSLEGAPATIVVSESHMSLEIDENKRTESEVSGDLEAKPKGLPPMTEMITEALKHARELGASGLEPAGMVSYIRGRYWPNAPTQAVGPIAWRMWKRGELEKRDSIYTLLGIDGESSTNGGAADFASGAESEELQFGPEPHAKTGRIL